VFVVCVWVVGGDVRCADVPVVVFSVADVVNWRSLSIKI